MPTGVETCGARSLGPARCPAHRLPFLLLPILPHRDLSGLQLASGSASFLWGLTQLSTLRLAGTQVGAAVPAALSWSAGWRGGAQRASPRLDRLAVFLCKQRLSFPALPSPSHLLQLPADQLVSGLSSLRCLVQLDASGTGLDDACCRELAPLAGLTSLK